MFTFEPREGDVVLVLWEELDGRQLRAVGWVESFDGDVLMLCPVSDGASGVPHRERIRVFWPHLLNGVALLQQPDQKEMFSALREYGKSAWFGEREESFAEAIDNDLKEKVNDKPA